MKEEMEKLIDLQRIDSEIASYDLAISKHEAAIAHREQSIAEKQEKLTAIQSKIERLNQKQQETKTELDEAGARVKDRQNKMLLVQNSREHQALLKEIEDNIKTVQDNEERILQFIEQIEQLEEEALAVENLCKGEQELLTEAMQTAEKEIKDLGASKKSILGQREAKAAALDASFFKRYNKLLAKRDGLAVVMVQDSVCRGCNMTLPPQQVNEVLKGDKLNICPTCQRILYILEEDPREMETSAQDAAK